MVKFASRRVGLKIQESPRSIGYGRTFVGRTGQVISQENYDDPYYKIGDPTPGEGYRFIYIGLPYAIDIYTGLMWVRDSGNTVSSWGDGITACESSTVGGFTDWRMPTITELLSLLDFGGANPPYTYPNPFLGSYNASFWSSTTQKGTDTSAWGINYYAGSMNPGAKSSSTYRVRPVRGPVF